MDNTMKTFFRIFRIAILTALVILTYYSMGQESKYNSQETKNMENKVIKTDKEWKEILNEKQYYILREAGTEAPFTGEFYQHKEKGTYHCAACGNKLFISDTKFASGCGWPSFYKAFDEGSVVEKLDTSHGMVRTEIRCAKCDGHLGHVFNDGPEPTGLRYCINSAALSFNPLDEKKQD
jgi:peptide-methionine (R)-S-oxide reductase